MSCVLNLTCLVFCWLIKYIIVVNIISQKSGKYNMSSKIAEIRKIILLMIIIGVRISVDFTRNSCNVSNSILIHKVSAILEHKICFIRFVSFVWVNDI